MVMINLANREKPPTFSDARLQSKSDHILPKTSQHLTSLYLSLLTGEVMPLGAEEQEVVASILCFLVPKSLRTHLGFYSYCLNEEDRKEIRKYKNPERCLSVSAARVVLRLAICMIANGGSPGDWSFTRTKSGKLKIENLNGFDCSISYTDETDAVAVSRGVAIGLDVESSRLIISQDMIQSFLSKTEILQLDKSEPAQRHECFLKAWAIKESLVKLFGTGLSQDIKWIDTSHCENQLLYTNGQSKRVIVFASRISELTGGSEHGWLALAQEILQETKNPITKLAFYRVTGGHSPAT